MSRRKRQRHTSPSLQHQTKQDIGTILEISQVMSKTEVFMPPWKKTAPKVLPLSMLRYA